MSSSIRMGFIGAGTNTRLRHLPGLAEIEGVSLSMVANRSEASSRTVAEEFGIARIAPDWKTVVEDPEIDAVCIGTWPYMHAELSIAALKEGKHVLTEARMASSLGEARAMHAESVAHPDLVAQIVPSPFTLDLDKTVVGLIESGTLGEIVEVFIDHSHGAYVDPDGLMTWRQDHHYSGINMLTMGIYHEVIQRWFEDACSVEHVTSGIVQKERVHWESGLVKPVIIPDYVHIIGRLERGAVLNYHFSGIEAGPGRNLIKVVGTQGTLRMDVQNAELFLSGDDGSEQPIVVPSEQRRGWKVEADFIESIRNGMPVELTSFSEGLRYMEFTDAVYQRLTSLSY
jgi:predicted dehydrogenase